MRPGTAPFSCTMTRLSRINIVFPSALESSSTIDGEYYSRIVFQWLTADTKTGTFVWMLDEFKAARGAAPDMFIQDADAAMTQAADRVFPDAKKRRCMWHLGKNLLTNLRGLLGGHFNVSRNIYLIVVCVLQRTLDRPLKKCSALLPLLRSLVD